MSKRWVFDESRCKGCGLCVDACPEEIIGISDRINRSGYRMPEITDQRDCISCGFCARVCPDVAIEIYRPEKRDARSAPDGGEKI